ncbi:unnamed protein product, partial [Polarella glacialis]
LGYGTALVKELPEGTQKAVAVIAQVPLGTMVAASLPAASNAIGVGYVAVVVQGSQAAALLPRAVWANSSSSGSLSLVMTVIGSNSSTGAISSRYSSYLGGSKVSWAFGASAQLAASAVDVMLVYPSNGIIAALQVDLGIDTEYPMLVRISSTDLPAGTRCAYLGADGLWSRAGVREATVGEVQDVIGTSNATGFWCASSHLSIFGAILDLALDCTNANVLSAEGLQNVQSRSDWGGRPPAVLLWILLAFLSAALVAGVAADRQAAQKGFWRRDFFLTPMPPIVARSSSGDDGSLRSRCGSCATSCVPRCYPALLAAAAGFHKSTTESEKKLALAVLVCGVQHLLASRTRLDVKTLRSHVWGLGGWVQGSLAVAKSKVLASRVQDLEDEKLHQAFYDYVTAGFLWRSWLVKAAFNPLAELSYLSVHVSAGKRAKLLADELLGTLALSALLFSVSGSAVAARNPTACEAPRGSFGWLVLVTLTSAALNALPRTLLYNLAVRSFQDDGGGDPRQRQQQLLRSRSADLRFWLVGGLLSGLHLLVILGFLAQLGEADEWKWLFSFSFVLASSLLLGPGLFAACLATATQLAVARHPELARQPPFSLGVDLSLCEKDEEVCWENLTGKGSVALSCGPDAQKVEELAGRAISVGHLLEFYEMLGRQVMPHFDPKQSTTHDVVRCAIIPLSLPWRSGGLRTCSIRISIFGLRHMKCDDEGTSSRPLLRCSFGVRGPSGHRKFSGGCSAAIMAGGSGAADAGSLAWNYEGFADEFSLPGDSLEFEVSSEDLVLGSASLESAELRVGVGGGFFGEPPMQPLSLGALEVHVEVIDADDDDAAVDAAGDMDENQEPLTTHASGRKFQVNQEEEPENYLSSSDEQSKAILMLPNVEVQVPDGQEERKTQQQPGRDACVVGRAYASVVNCDRPLLAGKMVTHNWSNTFSHLLAAVLADALGLETFDGVLELLFSGQFEELRERLRAKGGLDLSYWVCAFSVNQHAGICDKPPSADSSGVPLQPCSCSTAKYLSGSLCEMNKFDEMMAFLKHANRLRRRQLRKLLTEEAAINMKRFGQVVAVDVNFELLGRVWCVAELVEAHRLHLPQVLMIHSAASRERCLQKLRHLDVREAEASFAADKELILGKIEDVDIFNEQLKGLLLRQLNLFMKRADSLALAAFRDTVIQVLAF